MKAAWIGMGLIVLGACTPAPEEETPAVTPPADSGLETRAPDTCNAASYAELLNQPREAASVVPEPKRVVAPTDIVTSDYIPNRVNIGVNEAGIITELGCG